MEQIRIFKGKEPLNDNVTVYFDSALDARSYLKLIRKTWPKTVTNHRSIKLKEREYRLHG